MFTQMTIDNFRGLHHLEITDLRRINLIVGLNNSGKSTLLEGLFLFSGATNPLFATILGQLRGQRLGGTYPDPVWRPLFYQMEPKTNIEIRGRWAGETEEGKLTIEALEAPPFSEVLDSGVGGGSIASMSEVFSIGGLRLSYVSNNGKEVVTQAIFDPKTGNIEAKNREREDSVRATFVSARAYPSSARDARQFSSLLRIKQEGQVLEGMQILEPSVRRIEVLSEPGGPSVYVDVGLKSLIPLAACGEGFVRLFTMIVELTASRGGLLLIDEIDNGLHYSVLNKLWALLDHLTKLHGVQLVATTHNEELIQSALEAFASKPDDLGLFRIDKRDGKHSIANYDAIAQEAIRLEHFEVRG